MAAITAARTGKSLSITVIEKKEKAGKKILATGNGRCNLTNREMNAKHFRSEHPEYVEPVLKKFDYEDTMSFFSSLGLLLKHREDYVYPRNDQAASVLESLLKEADRLGVKFLLDEFVISVRKKGTKQFEIQTSKQKLLADNVILSTGGKASSKLGSDGSGYDIAKKLGHHLEPICPALVQLKVKQNPLAQASGVRTQALVTAYVDGEYQASDTGELQLTNYGVSGIPIFQISRYISKGLLQKKKCMVRIDFLPEYKQKNCKKLLLGLINGRENVTISDLLLGIFPSKLVPVFLKMSHLSGSLLAGELSEVQLEALILSFKRMDLCIFDTMGFDQAQVCAGGVSLLEIDPENMMSRICPGFYLTGEVLDVDGICGGYNLQWAWSTGYLAGKHASL